MDWLTQQTPQAARLLEAFVRGMNDYAARHPETLDPQRRPVLPVAPIDVLAHTQRVIHLMFVAEEEAQRARAAFEEEKVAASRPEDRAGSNAWAIAPKRSASGRALLVANPHLPWGDFFTWFEAHLSAPGVDATGATLVGQNLLGIAFNRHLGWTHTVNTIDAADTYELTVVDGGYRYDGAVRPFDTTTHRLKVRQEDGSVGEEVLVVKRSVHGPVIAEKPGKALALRVAGLDQPRLADQYWRMIRARNLNEFQDALRLLQMPMFTVIYADSGGHILHLFGGRTPRRPGGDYDWSGTVPGDTSKTFWTETHAYDELPRALDPESGWLQNANDPPWTTTFPLAFDPRHFPPYMAPRGMGFRPQRSARMLAEDESLDWDELLADKHSTRMELADRLLDDLAAAVRAHGDETSRLGLSVLEKWDRTADNESRGGTLFAEWVKGLPPDDAPPSSRPRGARSDRGKPPTVSPIPRPRRRRCEEQCSGSRRTSARPTWPGARSTGSGATGWTSPPTGAAESWASSASPTTARERTAGSWPGVATATWRWWSSPLRPGPAPWSAMATGRSAARSTAPTSWICTPGRS